MAPTCQPANPFDEIAKRVGDYYPGVEAAKMAVGIEDHRRMLRDYARRVADSHKAMAKAAGMGELVADAEVDDMGDIIISGDHISTFPQSRTPAIQSPARPTGMGGLAKAAVVGSSLLGLGGLGAAAAAYLMPNRPTTSAPIDAGARIRVFWGDQEIPAGKIGEANVTKESQ